MKPCPSLAAALRLIFQRPFCFIRRAGLALRRKSGASEKAGFGPRRILPALVVFSAGLGASAPAQAYCLWNGLDWVSAPRLTLKDIGEKLMAGKYWFEDPKKPYDVGTLMGVREPTFQNLSCRVNTFDSLAGKRVVQVYVPPPNAQVSGRGFRIPTTNPAVMIGFEFPGGRPFEGAIEVARSSGSVTGNGALPNGFSTFASRISIVKTGPFVATARPGSSDLAFTVPGGLGSFRYYPDDGGPAAVFQEQLVFPDTYGGFGRHWQPYAGAPNCEVVSAKLIPDVITLPDVSSARFTGIGAIEDSAKTENVEFRCWGLESTRPTITFDATYPLLNGAAGVGLPKADSDIGVQIFLDDLPVHLGREISISTDMRSFPFREPEGSPPDSRSRGYFCIHGPNCTADMDGSEWTDGKSAIGQVTAPFRFKYYQTTAAKPAAQSFRVAFSITLDVN